MDNPLQSSPDLKEIKAMAFGRGDDAYAWKKEVLPDVLDALAAAGIAVVGGEVWGLRGYEIFGALPTHQGHTRIFAWSAPSIPAGTDWRTFIDQCVQLAHQAVRDLNAETEVIPAFRDHLVYHLHFFSEEDYPRPRSDREVQSAPPRREKMREEER